MDYMITSQLAALVEGCVHQFSLPGVRVFAEFYHRFFIVWFGRLRVIWLLS